LFVSIENGGMILSGKKRREKAIFLLFGGLHNIKETRELYGYNLK